MFNMVTILVQHVNDLLSTAEADGDVIGFAGV